MKYQLSNLFLPVVTDRERRLRRVVLLGPVALAGLALLTVALVAAGKAPPSAMFVLPLLWVLLMAILVAFTRLAGAHHDALMGLRASGYPHCPSCTYDLSGLGPADPGGPPLQCPECGKTSTTEQRQAKWEGVYARLTMRKDG